MEDERARHCAGADCSAPGTVPANEAQAETAAGGRFPAAVFLASEVLGRGDDELGQILMKAFLDTLSHFARDISHIVLVNSGVKLAVEGSPVLPHLRQLEEMGAEILACGTCLNHYQLREKLKAGKVSNMFAIIEVLSKATKVITP